MKWQAAEPHRSQTGIQAPRAAVLSFCLAMALSAVPLLADDEVPSNEELDRRLNSLAEEVDDMKLGAVAGKFESQYGFGPAASKIYGVEQGFSLGGYGEMLYQNFSGKTESGIPSSKTSSIDYLRQIIYFGYKFDHRLLFNSEIEFEHASTGKRGEASLEFAYLDLLVRPELNVRGGLLLMPLGFINELHEPPTFFGALRPETERVIIPTTWRANGAGIFGNATGTLEGLSYRAYLVESLSSVGGENGENFSSSGLRAGRQKGSKALMEHVGYTVRADYQRSGLQVGGSVFTGGTAQNDTTSTGENFTGRTTIYEGHLQYRRKGLQARALLAASHVDEAQLINEANGLTGSDGVGSRLVGGYLEVGYNLLHSRAADSPWKLIPYARWEQVNTHDEVPDGVVVDPTLKRQILTLGAALYPHSQVVIKGDYVSNTNQASTGLDQFNLTLGYHF